MPLDQFIIAPSNDPPAWYTKYFPDGHKEIHYSGIVFDYPHPYDEETPLINLEES